jgi:hypothetical protein
MSLAVLVRSAVLRRYLYCLAEQRLASSPDEENTSTEAWAMLDLAESLPRQHEKTNTSENDKTEEDTITTPEMPEGTRPVRKELIDIRDFSLFGREVNILRKLREFKEWERTGDFQGSTEVFASAVRSAQESRPGLPTMEVYRAAIERDDVIRSSSWLGLLQGWISSLEALIVS